MKAGASLKVPPSLAASEPTSTFPHGRPSGHTHFPIIMLALRTETAACTLDKRGACKRTASRSLPANGSPEVIDHMQFSDRGSKTLIVPKD